MQLSRSYPAFVVWCAVCTIPTAFMFIKIAFMQKGKERDEKYRWIFSSSAVVWFSALYKPLLIALHYIASIIMALPMLSNVMGLISFQIQLCMLKPLIPRRMELCLLCHKWMRMRMWTFAHVDSVISSQWLESNLIRISNSSIIDMKLGKCFERGREAEKWYRLLGFFENGNSKVENSIFEQNKSLTTF